jgi:hypothetical protein
MINCVLINNNEITEIKVKNLTENTIYKKCNFKSDKDFQLIKSFNYDLNEIELWGKILGQSNLKNDFPYFINNNLSIYGKCIFIMKKSDKYISLNKEFFIKFLENTDKIDNTNNSVNNLTNKPTNKPKNNDKTEDNSSDDNSEEDVDSECSFNSELSYELYEYSDDDTIEKTKNEK